MTKSPFSLGTKILAGGAFVLLLFLAIGFLLPADWEATGSRVFEVPAEAVYGLMDSPEGWRAWTPWPDSVVREGPERGPGSAIRWNDPDVGTGSFQIVEVVPARRVVYAVEVSDGAMLAQGTLELSPSDGGVLVDWREEGDLGRNPLMGYWALGMGRAQSAELQKNLERLSTLLSDSSRTR